MIEYVCSSHKIVGPFLLATSEKGICALLLGADLVKNLRDRFPNEELVEASKESALQTTTLERVLEHMDDPSKPLELPLDLRGTEFQKKVWDALLKVPCGKVATYTDIANAIGSPRAVRAVGTAIGANPVCFIVPCHRIVKKGGSLGGYEYGPELKLLFQNMEKNL